MLKSKNHGVKNLDKGKSTVLVGMQYGDEGKAKVLDAIIEGTPTESLYNGTEFSTVVRFNGGSNAGHTITKGDVKLVTHQIPSGIFYDDIDLHIGYGCVFNPIKFLEEKSGIEENGFNIDDKLRIDSQTSLVQPHHTKFDQANGGKIGTTGNGIGPAYSDIATRSLGGDLVNLTLGRYINNPHDGRLLVKKNLKRLNLEGLNLEKEVNNFHYAVMKCEQYISENEVHLLDILDSGKNIIYEGANSVLLDVKSGPEPFVTSSRTLVPAAYTGSNVPSNYHDKAIGVVKAIMSRVGNGPFVGEFGGNLSEEYCDGYENVKKTEISKYGIDKIDVNDQGIQTLLKSKDDFEVGVGLRLLGGEYGATTKRPRRIGALDLVQLKQSCRVNGIDILHINKVDCLNQFSETSFEGIPVIVGYELDGEKISYRPKETETLRRIKPVFKHLNNFTDDISNLRSYDALPKEAQGFVEFIEKYTGVKVGSIGVGPERDDIIYKI